ncbi:MAG: antitoxin AF2212-like protein [Pirellulales bacterium]
MKAELTAIVEGGVLKPDTAVPFPDHTRVRLTIEPVESPKPRLAAWERLLQMMDEKPLVGLAGKFSRDELYECD